MRIATLIALVVAAVFSCAGGAWANVELIKVGEYYTGQFDAGAAEIVAYDPVSKRLFMVDAANNAIDVLDFSDGKTPTHLEYIDITKYGGGLNSVAVKNGLVAAAVEAEVKTDPGRIVLFNADGRYLADFPAGPQPDMIVFSPDGRYILTANEGEPNDDYSVDPEGGVTIVHIGDGLEKAEVKQADFRMLNHSREELRRIGVRISYPNASVSQDLEPEYIAVSPDGKQAYVTLQENNALAVVDLELGRVVNVLPLGIKNWAGNGWGLDASDKDGGINFYLWPVSGLYMPDAVAAYNVGGNTYLVTANEGDSREYGDFTDEIRVRLADLDHKAFPNALELKDDTALGRLKAVKDVSDTDNDGDLDRIVAFGGRSFSIWDENGELVFDSGDDFERITADVFPEMFNADNDENIFDVRSDDKGPEPEGATLGEVEGRIYAFIGLERVGGVMVYDVTHPAQPKFVEYVNDRDWDGDPGSGNAGHLGPEGLLFISAEDSPNGRRLLVVAHEVSGSLVVYEVAPRGQEPIALGAKLLDRYTLSGERSFYDGHPARGKDGAVNVVIEMPAGSVNVWRVDPVSGYMEWARKDGEPARIPYLGAPANLGFVPRTRIEAPGDQARPLPVVVLGPALPRGAVTKAKPIGVVKLIDGEHVADRVLAVQSGTPFYHLNGLLELNREYRGVTTLLQTWFENARGPGAWRVEGFGEAPAAEQMVEKAIENYREEDGAE